MGNMNEPLVSVVIPWYNDPYICRTLNSVLQQTYRNIEIVVVDDGSTQYLDYIEPFKPHIRYMRKENGGVASAMNHGMTYATGKYVVWLSGDDLLAPTKVRQQVAFMEGRGAQISYTDYHYINENDNIYQTFKQTPFASERALAEAAKTHCPININTVMMLKSFFHGMNGFDVNLRYANDYDFFIRVLLNRTPIHYLAEPLTHYRFFAGMDSLVHAQEMEQDVAAIRNKHMLSLQALTASMG
jgi:glycosyltransferase involved in cell wall biosynthesis